MRRITFAGNAVAAVVGTFLLLTATAHAVIDLGRLGDLLCLPGSVVARAFTTYQPVVPYVITLKDVALAALIYATLTMIWAWTWRSRRRWLNLAHACFIVGVGVLATIQFAPHQKFDAWKSKDFGISLLGDNKITAFWRSAIRPEGPPKTWVPIKNLDGNYVVLGWYVKIPGVQHVVTTVPFSAGVGSDKAGVHVHGLKVSPAVAALPAGLYLLVALLFYLPSSRGKPCRKCGYNLRGEAGPTCPGCKEPTNPSMEAGQ